MRRVAGLLLSTVLVAACGAGSTEVGPFDGAEATVEAVNITFEPVEITLPAGVPLRIVLDNRDSGIPHNVRVIQGDTEFGKSPIVTGPGLTEVRFGPLTPARYQFTCDVHPNMLGTLIVTP